ncbi:MAG: GNAT family N-acetyltransferase [Planctomycetota bacterium]
MEPAEEYAAAAAEMAADFEAAGEERADLPDVAAYIKRCRAYARGAVPKGHVPTTTYWLVGDDGAVLGSCRLRQRLTDALWQDGGHIGYDIRPSCRNRSYATRMLAMVLKEARQREMDWVLLTVDPANRPSIRVIEKNGGEKIGTASKSGYLQFRIRLLPA